MSGDELTIRLFFFGLMVTLVVAGVQQAGWKHRTVVWVLLGLGLLGGIFGIEWGPISTNFPGLKPYVSSIAGSPVSWFSLIFFGLSASFWINRQQKKAESIESNAGPNTLSRAVRVAFRAVPEYLPEKEHSEYVIIRSVLVGLKNEGNGWLSGCLLEVVSIAPPPLVVGNSNIKALAPACDLPFGMERPMTLCSYNRILRHQEQTAPLANGPTIFFSAPGTYGGGANTVLSPDVIYSIRLRASANECKSHEVDLRIWVDGGRLLQAELLRGDS
jgi:hypothetical protein